MTSLEDMLEQIALFHYISLCLDALIHIRVKKHRFLSNRFLTTKERKKCVRVFCFGLRCPIKAFDSRGQARPRSQSTSRKKSTCRHTIVYALQPFDVVVSPCIVLPRLPRLFCRFCFRWAHCPERLCKKM